MAATPTEVTVCLVDSGLLPNCGAAARVVAGINLSGHGEIEDLTAAGNAHGTQAAETVLAECPQARLAILRVIDDDGWLAGEDAADRAMAWISDHLASLPNAVICAAFGDMFHHRSDQPFRATRLCRVLHELRAFGVLTVTAAGNMYPRFRQAYNQGMAWPAILRETVSVGALDADRLVVGQVALDGFSQRLHASLGTGCATTLFAPPGPPGDSSGAAARVAGWLARLRSANPAASADDLLAQLLVRSRSVSDPLTGLEWRRVIDPFASRPWCD